MTFCHRRCTVVPSFHLENREQGRDVPTNTLLSQKNQIRHDFCVLHSFSVLCGNTHDARSCNALLLK